MNIDTKLRLDTDYGPNHHNVIYGADVTFDKSSTKEKQSRTPKMNSEMEDVKAGGLVYTPGSVSPKNQHGFEKPQFYSPGAGSDSKDKKKLFKYP